MSEPVIPREVWGIWNDDHLVNFDDYGAFTPFESRESAAGFMNLNGTQIVPVLIGGSALLEEVEKLRKVAEAAVPLSGFCSHERQ